MGLGLHRIGWIEEEGGRGRVSLSLSLLVSCTSLLGGVDSIPGDEFLSPPTTSPPPQLERRRGPLSSHNPPPPPALHSNPRLSRLSTLATPRIPSSGTRSRPLPRAPSLPRLALRLSSWGAGFGGPLELGVLSEAKLQALLAAVAEARQNKRGPTRPDAMRWNCGTIHHAREGASLSLFLFFPPHPTPSHDSLPSLVSVLFTSMVSSLLTLTPTLTPHGHPYRPSPSPSIAGA